MRRRFLLYAAALLWLSKSADDAMAARPQEGPTVFAGKTIQLFVGFPSGSAYDLIARIVGRHIALHIPGHPSLIVQDMPGAASLQAANYLFNIAPANGLALGIVSQDVVAGSLINKKGVYFDASKFSWLGSATKETLLAIAKRGARVASLQDLYSAPLLVGESGSGGGASLFPRVLDGLLGLKFQPVGGYPDVPDVFLAMDRGEVEGSVTSYSTLKLLRPDWIPQRKVNVLFQAGSEPNPSLKDVPFLPNFAKDDNQRSALRLLFTGQGVGKAFLAPPNLDPATLAVLREAFDATMTDPAFISEMAREKIDLDPTRGPELAAEIDRVYGTPRAVVEEVSQLLR